MELSDILTSFPNKGKQYMSVEMIEKLIRLLKTYRKNISPGNDMYIISRLVHSPVLFLMMKPTRPPLKTPRTVNIVSIFSPIKARNFDLACGAIIFDSGRFQSVEDKTKNNREGD